MILTKSTLADPTGRKDQKAGYISDYYLKKNTEQKKSENWQGNAAPVIKSGAYNLNN